MGTKNNPGGYDCYAHAAPDEPMFILLGRDATASDLVRLWAHEREATRDDLGDKIAEARRCADHMDQWRTEKLNKPARSVLAGLPFDLLADELRRRGASVEPVAHGGDFSNDDGEKLDQIVLEAGQAITLRGFPFALAQKTVVLGIAKNLELAASEVQGSATAAEGTVQTAFEPGEKKYLIIGGGDGYSATIVGASQLDHAFLSLHFSPVSDSDADQHKVLLDHLHDEDNWSGSRGKPQRYTADYEDGYVEVIELAPLLGDFAHIPLPDDLNYQTKELVAGFAEAMAAKLYKKQRERGDDWLTDDWQADCQRALIGHVGKGDPIDVANFCAFMWKRGWPTSAPASGEPLKDSELLSIRDAQIWAQQFKLRFPYSDEELMLSWFANAIETGVNFGHSEQPAPAPALPDGATIIPLELLRIIDAAFLPLNPNKLRNATPEAKQAAIEVKRKLSLDASAATAGTEGATNG